jgi:hypothetical protein
VGEIDGGGDVCGDGAEEIPVEEFFSLSDKVRVPFSIFDTAVCVMPRMTAKSSWFIPLSVLTAFRLSAEISVISFIPEVA